MSLLHKRYRVVGPIGEGGMGTVQLADDVRLPGRQCAIKRLHVPPGASAATAAALRERFVSEAKILARLDHPALPKVSDFFEADGCVHLVMDYVPGQDLQLVLVDALRRGHRLAEAQVVGWAEDVCDALSYLHAQTPPVIHRDVKPANIKLTPDGQVRLVDFGLAQITDPAGAATLTAPVGAGTRPYQPLEQYGDGSAVDQRTDVYALGATLYHLLTGHAPPSAQARFLDRDALVPVRDARTDVSRRVAAAVADALSLHPDGRPPTMLALRGLLTGQASGTAVGGRTAEELAAKVILWVVAAALLVLAVALTAWP